MATDQERADYLAAYEALVAKTESYKRTLDLVALSTPDSYDRHAMKRETDELARLHADFIAKSQPLWTQKQ